MPRYWVSLEGWESLGEENEDFRQKAEKVTEGIKALRPGEMLDNDTAPGLVYKTHDPEEAIEVVGMAVQIIKEAFADNLEDIHLINRILFRVQPECPKCGTLGLFRDEYCSTCGTWLEKKGEHDAEEA